ncbi:MAG: 16S rRNA (adenine(1518)-N(6)/adenine(1519)-N(6))-dimethyltransferase RsmA [Clostridia bacterium]|nr:16S rRNA (adenine(1518)-N(6)/adenine(1519)-N(6))-dimethyltransferase RsmA [Clostridia bacterium]
MELCNISVIKSILEEHGLKMQKALGQNFLINPEVPRRIAASVEEADTVLEIGPGIGCLTAELCKVAKEVIAIELDRGLIPVLADTLSEFDNVTVINNDVLKVDLHSLLADKGKVAVCANLPYYITTPILMYLIESGLNLASITVMVQNEVAVRLASSAGSAEYGAVTVAVSAFGSVKKILNVPAGNFYPAPKVDSAVIRITPHEKPLCPPEYAERFRGVVRAAFAQRRKKLSNAICSVYPQISKEKLSDLLVEMGHTPDVRGERLACEQFVRIATELL